MKLLSILLDADNPTDRQIVRVLLKYWTEAVGEDEPLDQLDDVIIRGGNGKKIKNVHDHYRQKREEERPFVAKMHPRVCPLQHQVRCDSEKKQRWLESEAPRECFVCKHLAERNTQ